MQTSRARGSLAGRPSQGKGGCTMPDPVSYSEGAKLHFPLNQYSFLSRKNSQFVHIFFTSSTQSAFILVNKIEKAHKKEWNMVLSRVRCRRKATARTAGD